MMLLLPIRDPSTSGITGCQEQYPYHAYNPITYSIQLQIRSRLQ